MFFELLKVKSAKFVCDFFGLSSCGVGAKEYGVLVVHHNFEGVFGYLADFECWSVHVL